MLTHERRLCEASEFGRALLLSAVRVTSTFTDTNRRDKRSQSNAVESLQDQYPYSPDNFRFLERKPQIISPSTVLPRLHVGPHFLMLSSCL